MRGNVSVSAAGEACSLMFEVLLAVGKSGQFLAGRGGSSLVGKLPDRGGGHMEQAGVLLAEWWRDRRRGAFCGGVE
jgi:hypothetical protein